MSKILGSNLKQWLHRMIHLKESPYRIAMGCSCGIFCSALPIFGQTFIAIIFSRILKASVIASIPWTWISNPLTTLPMWYGGYRLGIWIMPSKHKSLSYTEIQTLIQDLNQMDLVKGLSLLSTEFWEALQPLWLGTVVMGLAMALPSFIIIYKVLVRRRQKRMVNY